MWALASDERKQMISTASPEQKAARDRMALFPTAQGGHGGDGGGGERSEVIFVEEDKWVPVVRLGGKVSFCRLRRPTRVVKSRAEGSCAYSPGSRVCSNSCSSV